MNSESPWKKNPFLNIGMLLVSIGMLMFTFFDSSGLLGGTITIVGWVLFYLGYRKAKASGAPPAPVNERRKKLRLMMAALVAGFLISVVQLWPRISKFKGAGLWVFLIGMIVVFSGLCGFLVWQYKKAGNNSTTSN